MRDSFIRIALLGFEGDFKDTVGKVSWLLMILETFFIESKAVATF